MTLAELNALSRTDAERALSQCCGSSRWAAMMTRRRPFPTDAELQLAAEEVWWSLDEGDWLEAFSHHPRIGERATGWAGGEQSGARGASSSTVQALERRNREYEEKFGHVFLIYATGKSADEMLSALEHRIQGDAQLELRIAAGEQAKITRLRLQKLLATEHEPSGTR